MNNQQKNQHLMWRAAFGPAYSDIRKIDSMSVTQLYQQLKADSQGYNRLNVAVTDTPADLGAATVMQGGKPNASESEHRKRAQKNKTALKSVNALWINEMVSGKSQLREKVALFWHGHFACGILNPVYQQELLHIVRSNALGSFADMLKQVSKSAAMMVYLNMRANVKDSPNENFAREVMELFTLGKGNYTEQDIKNGARAFTGWSFNNEGKFIFRPNLHDSGAKVFLGKRGNFNGDDIIKMLLERKETAKYIAGKMYKYFVNEQNTDQARVNWLADRFFAKNYNIQLLLDDIFTSDWFYDDVHYGAKVKSPVDLYVGMQRMVPFKLTDSKELMIIQSNLGQILFSPPNVAGWPGGYAWIDSSTLMLRLKLARILLDNGELDLKQKQNDDIQMGLPDDDDKIAKKEKGKGKGKGKGKAKGADALALNPSVNWAVYQNAIKALSADKLAGYLLQTTPQNFKGARVVNTGNALKAGIKQQTLALMATPEYQMC